MYSQWKQRARAPLSLPTQHVVSLGQQRKIGYWYGLPPGFPNSPLAQAKALTEVGITNTILHL